MLQLLYKPKIQGRVFYTLQIVLFQQQETEKYFCKQSADLFWSKISVILMTFVQTHEHKTSNSFLTSNFILYRKILNVYFYTKP